MRPFRTAMIISLLLHTAILVFCYYYILPYRQNPQMEIAFISEPAVTPPVPIPQARTVKIKVETKVDLPSAPAEPPLTEEETIILSHKDSLRQDSPGIEPYFAPQSYSGYYFQPESLHLSLQDSLREKRLAAVALAPYRGARKGFDRVQNDLYLRNLGHTPPLPLTALIGAGVQALNSVLPKSPPRPVRLTHTPSMAEVATLCAIWEIPEPTLREIYGRMDATIRLTASDLDQILLGLTERGLLSREMISPRDELTIISPVGGVGIEKSSLNRRNRVYRYKSRIDRQHMMNYLQARLYEQRGKTAGDSTRILQQLILRMMK